MDSTPPVDVLLDDAICKLQAKKPVTKDAILEILIAIKITSESSENAKLPRNLSEKLSQLTIGALVNQPQLFDDALSSEFCSCLTLCSSEVKLVTPAIIESLSGSTHSRTCWFKFEFLLSKALACDLLSPETLEGQTLTCLKENIDERALNQFASCLQSVVNSYRRTRSKSYQSEEFLEILDWLSWFCQAQPDEF